MKIHFVSFLLFSVLVFPGVIAFPQLLPTDLDVDCQKDVLWPCKKNSKKDEGGSIGPPPSKPEGEKPLEERALICKKNPSHISCEERGMVMGGGCPEGPPCPIDLKDIGGGCPEGPPCPDSDHSKENTR